MSIKTCAAPTCRTSLDEYPVTCSHGVEFCGDCVFEETCAECAARLVPAGVLVTDADPETPEWFAARRGGITGTDLPKILGLSKYGNALSVWLDKRGEWDDEAGEAAEWGHILEDPIAQKWARDNGLRVERVGVLAHDDYPWMRASLDRIVHGCPDGQCGLEVKTRSAFVAGKWRDGMPDDVLAQVAWGRYVSGLHHMHVAVLIGGQTMHTFRYEQDAALEKYLIEAAAPVWAAVGDGVPPEAHPDSDGVLLDMLNKMYERRAGDRELPEAAREWLEQYVEASDLERQAKRDKTEAKTALVQMLDDGHAGLLDGLPAFTYKAPAPAPTVTADALDRLAAEQPDNYAALLDEGYITQTNPGPRFNLARTNTKETAA